MKTIVFTLGDTHEMKAVVFTLVETRDEDYGVYLGGHT